MTMAFWVSRSTNSEARTSVSGRSGGRSCRTSISSTTTAMEWGSSSCTPSSAASRISSAMEISRGSSEASPSGKRTGPSGRCAMSLSASRATWSPVTADTGTTSAHSIPTWRPRSDTSASRSARVLLATVSTFVTTATIGLLRRKDSCVAMNRSPGPTAWSAGMHMPTTSTLVQVSRTWSLRRSPRRVRGRCSPGVSTMMSWPSARFTTPRRTRRVVCGRSEVMATLRPTRALVRVDLPALGRPTRQTNPLRKITSWLLTLSQSGRPGSRRLLVTLGHP